MSKIKITIKNGYGIEKFDEEFNFDTTPENPHNNTQIIYAQNGTMKSFFTKTLQSKDSVRDYIRGKDGKCSVLDTENQKEIDQDHILAVPSFDNSPLSKNDKLHLLLANEELRNKYNELISEREKALHELTKELLRISKAKNNIDIVKEFCSTFASDQPANDDIFISLIKKNLDQIQKAPDYILDLPYKIVGEQYVKDFAKKHADFLNEFIKRYDKVIKTASYMRNGFGTKGAEDVGKILKESNFFKAAHAVRLVDMRNPEKPKEKQVNNSDDLIKLLQSDFDRVFEDNPLLKARFKEILKTIDQKNRSDLKSLLENTNTRQILTLMQNPSQLKRNLWYGYLKGCKIHLDNVLAKDTETTDKLKDILKEAEHTKTQWNTVIDTFNRRFKHMPFKINISNRNEILLKGSKEVNIKYSYKTSDGKEHTLDGSEDLCRHLSTGERKAFYLLYLLFDIELCISSGDEHLIVLDDIIDSFDYKNKYAFLEYINDLSKKYDNLKIILLTHNFDFFRLLQSRLFGDKDRSHSWFAERKGSKVKLIQAGQFNHFNNTKSRATKNTEAYLSLIPFARNLIEYSLPADKNPFDNDHFKKLTQCLHLLDEDIKYSDIKDIIKEVAGVDGCKELKDDDHIIEKIIETANKLPPIDSFNILHNKTILSIASRLKAEEFMKNKLTKEELNEVKQESNFTRELYSKYINTPNYDKNAANILEEVNLITPEHIHLNSFMYEPLIDLSQEELEDLYERTKSLNSL